MTVLELATWASKNSVNFQDIGVAEIPIEQDELFWSVRFGVLPPFETIPAGNYLYYYASNYAFYIDVKRDGEETALVPDAVIDVEDSDDKIYLYRLDA